VNEPTEQDLARWARWDDLRARQAEATTDEEHAALKTEEEALSVEGTRELLEQDMKQPEGWWWLSFVNDDGEFLGVSIVRGGGVQEAAINARLIGCNPGGEVKAWPLINGATPEEQYRNRLLSKDELEEAGFGVREEEDD